MAHEIFDQDRPTRRSAMARRLDEAFAGCDEWTAAPPSPRRSEVDIAPWLVADRSRPIDRAAAAARPESRAA
jgi:hypothetical protein